MEDMAGLRSFRGERILVTGGTGFVGSHLVEALIKQGARVVVPYRSIDPHSYFNTRKLDRSVVLAVGDVTDRRRIVDIVTKYEIHTIYHLAAQPIVETAYYNPIETITTNILGTAHILDAAWTSGTVRQIFITSSDKAYGKSDRAYKEDHPLHGDHPYEASKSAADLIAHSYVKTYNAPVVIVRFGNIYGPGDLNMSRIVPGIMRSMVTGKELRLRSNGTFVRDYVYVGDVIDAYLFLHKHFGNAKGEAYNIASDTSVSVLGLIAQSEKFLKTRIRYSIQDTQKNEIPYQHVDWSKIGKLGWKPQCSLEMGLLETYRWYKRNKQILE
jgi:CDP-glucose 4,6-dehydratase